MRISLVCCVLFLSVGQPVIAATLYQLGGPPFLQTDFDHDLEGWLGEYHATGGKNYSSLSSFDPSKQSGYVRGQAVDGSAEFTVPADYFADDWVPWYQGGLFCWAVRADQPGNVTATVELVAGGELFTFATQWPQVRVGWEHGGVNLSYARPDWAALMHQVTSFTVRFASDNHSVSTFDLDSVALQVAPVPEPAGLVLGLVGSLVAMVFKRPQRRASR